MKTHIEFFLLVFPISRDILLVDNLCKYFELSFKNVIPDLSLVSGISQSPVFNESSFLFLS